MATAEASGSQRRNLVLRLVSAFGLLPLIIWLIWLGGWWFALLVAVVNGLATQEIYAMSMGGPAVTARPAKLPPVAWLGVGLSMGLPFMAPLGLVWQAVPVVLVAFLLTANAAAVLSSGDLVASAG